jgi:CHAT domain-containing protein
MSVSQHRDCPGDEVLQEMAAGISSPELAEQTMEHVARCRICGPALRRYVREFSAEESPENIRILQQLQSSKPAWQKRLVRQVSAPPKRKPWLRIVPVLAALLIVVTGAIQGPSMLAEFKIRHAQKQTAVAFADRRTTEMRLPSVDYAPYRPFPTVLGSESGRELDEIPPELTSASSAAAEKLRAEKADPRWLQVQGRALLWEATPSSLERAEKDFEKARSAGLASPSLEIDLAASYFERDSRAEHPNLQRTLNLLSEVLSEPKLSSDDRASALYNLAIAYEKTQAWDLAVSTWEKYLQVDSSSAWANEARQHLKHAKARLPARSEKSYDSPKSLLDLLAHHALQPEDLEQFQQSVLARWLPVALSDRKSDFYHAVTALADILAELHSDIWLKEFIAAERPGDIAGVEALTASVAANERGLYGPAAEQAEAAARLFAEKKNLPGRLFAQFQEVYAKRSLLQGEKCLVKADLLWDELSHTNYRWLQGQVALERAQCKNFHGDLADSDSDSKVSLSLAENSHFPVLELRVLGISASMQSQQGRCDGAWEQGIRGLQRYWQGTYPRDRLDQFYSVMWQCSEESGSLYAAEALLQHTIAMRQASNSRNSFREAMLHLRLRNMFMAQKLDAMAESEDAAASSLLKNLKQDDKVDATEYRLINDIEPAELQLQQGDPGRALATIERVGEMLKTVENDLVRLSFNRVLGSIDQELKRFDEATTAYQTAISIAEGGLDSLKDGNERLKWLKATDDSYRGLVRVLLEQKKDKEALDRWEWYQSRPLLQGFHSGGRPGSSTLPDKRRKAPTQALATSEATHLVYANFKDGLQIWTTTSRGVESTWVKVKQQDFERAVREFAERCSTPDSDLSEVQEQGAWLYSQLVQPVIAWLPESEVVVVELDRSAYNLSIEALTSPAGWYFGEKYPVVYSPGSLMEQALRAPAPVDPHSEVFVLDASHSPGSGYLPGMEAQKTAIAHIFPRTRIVDSAGTSWPEVAARLKSSQVFHYMGHGRRDGSGTTLVFNANESLRAKDIAPEHFSHSQLVVLAACSTAIGRDNGLLDTNSLVRAFLMAGVPRVIASHWDVDSETTSRLMITFYRGITNGESVAQAIYQARKEVLLSHAHPYYWASFSLTGRAS